jgi:flagella basal body P-ring formation protein FlgA
VAHAEGGIEPITSIRAAAEQYVGNQLQGARVDAGIDARLRLAECGSPLKPSTFGTPTNAAWTVAVSCDSPAWKLYVPVRVSSDRQVLVATRNLRAGETLTADAVMTQQRDTSQLPGGFVASSQLAVGKILRQPVAAGAAFSPDALGQAPAIKRGQLVTLLSRAGTIEVRAQGKALADGAAGDHITVENESSKRVVEGLVADDGSVMVSL